MKLDSGNARTILLLVRGPILGPIGCEGSAFGLETTKYAKGSRSTHGKAAERRTSSEFAWFEAMLDRSVGHHRLTPAANRCPAGQFRQFGPLFMDLSNHPRPPLLIQEPDSPLAFFRTDPGFVRVFGTMVEIHLAPVVVMLGHVTLAIRGEFGGMFAEFRSMQHAGDSLTMSTREIA